MNLVELKRLFLNELSAVDYPANELDGWMLMKSKSSSRLFPDNASVVKAAEASAGLQPERRLSLAPVYAPNSVDSHGEYVSAQELEDAVLKFAESGDRRLLLMHGDHGAHYVGTIVSVFTWPYAQVIKLRVPGETEREVEMPAGSAYAWIRWSKDVWPLVREGRGIRGLSMGGKALRVPGAEKSLPKMSGVGKAGRVLSAENITTLREVARMCQELLDTEPRSAQEQGIAKSAEGYLIVDEPNQVVWHVCPDRVEVLG